MDAQELEQIKQQLREELKAEIRAEQQDTQWKAGVNEAVQSANREQSWDRSHARTFGVRPRRDSAAGILGAALADQMVAGLKGTGLEDDGLGDGR